jgi:hypothetical protein
MTDKKQIIALLKEEFSRWEELLGSMSAAQITTPLAPSHWTTKDVVAHLRAWQQVSIARLEAVMLNKAPAYPDWFPGTHPAAGADTDKVNAKIYELYRNQPWSIVYQNWKQGFLHFIELAESLPKKDLFEVGRHRWLEGYPLSAVILGSVEHHRVDHYEKLVAWMQQHGVKPTE